MTREPTAAATASITITAIYRSAPPAINVVERYRRWFTNLQPRLSDTRPEASIYTAKPLKPAWLGSIQKTILNSIARSSGAPSGDGRWISQDVANAAAAFFETTADRFPG